MRHLAGHISSGSRRTQLIVPLCLCIPLCLLLFSFSQPVYADGFPIIGVLHAGARPEALALDTQTHMLYIADESPGVIVGFDPISGVVRWRTPVGDSATDVQVDSTTHRVYASASSFRARQNTLSVLDGATGGVVLTLPIASGDDGIALDAKRQRVYVAEPDNGTLGVFTFSSGWQSGPIHITSLHLHIVPHPQGLGVNTSLGRLYVADGTSVTVLDEDSGRILATVPVAGGPLHPLRVDEATGRVYIVCSTGKELDVLDGKANRIIARTPVAPDPEGVAFHTATGRIYVADEGNGHPVGTTITALDGQTFDVLGTLSVGRSPDGVEADPALHRVYVAAEDSNAVVEISDTLNLPLTPQTTLRQSAAAHLAIGVLQWATFFTLIAMCLTIICATLGALLPRWRERGSPQTLPDSGPSRLEKHSLPP
jgi:DNA-binding beta-propeller fold protein YncE